MIRDSVFDELRGMVIDLPVGKILPGWVTKDAVIRAIDRLEAECLPARPGFPLGWTALEHSATPSCRKSSKSSAGSSSKR